MILSIVGIIDEVRADGHGVNRIEKPARRRGADPFGFDWLDLILSLSWTHENPQPAADDGLRQRREGDSHAGLEVVLLRFVERRRIRVDRPRVDVELDDPIVGLLQRDVVVVSESVVERDVLSEAPLVLGERDVILLVDVLWSGSAVVERARLAQIAKVLDAPGYVRQKIGHIRVRVSDAALLVGGHPNDSGVSAELHEVCADNAAERVGKRQRVRIVRCAATISRAVGANELTRACEP